MSHRSLSATSVGAGVLSAMAFTALPAAAGFPGPLLQYGFDEASGDALDTGSAPLTDGALTGGAARSSDTPGGFSASSVDFTTESPYAHVLSTDAADLDGLGAFTLTTWLKVSDYTSGNNRLLAKQNGSSNFEGFSWNMNATPNTGSASPDNFRLALFLGGDGGFGFGFSDADVSGASDWVFLAATYDSGTGTVTYYQGDETNPVTQLGTPQVLANNPGVIDGLGAEFGVGFTAAAATADTSVNGLQDDVRVYGFAAGPSVLDFVRSQNLPEPGTAAALGLLVAGTLLKRRR